MHWMSVNAHNKPYYRPLDKISATPYACYSHVRRLAGDWTGSPWRIRRGIDSVEHDAIQRVDGTVNKDDLTTFITALDDGWVATMYDQSGNGRDLVQAVAGDQPQAFDGVISLSTKNGLPISEFLSGGIHFNHVDAGLTQPTTVMFLAQFPLHINGTYILDGGSVVNRMALYWNATNQLIMRSNSAQTITHTFNVTDVYLITAEFNGASSSLQVNQGTPQVVSPGALNPGGFTIGADATGSNGSYMYLQEWYIFDALLSASDKTILQDNLIGYYHTAE
jgi:hypothetical protein